MADRVRIAQSETRSAGQRRTSRMQRLAMRIDRLVPRGAGTLSALALVLASVGYGVVKGGHTEAVAAQIADIRDAAANSVGFEIASIALTGEKQLTREEILNIAGISGRASLLFLDADAARARLKANPWIADATILKLFPDRLHIAVTERRAFALWQKDGRVGVVSRDGVTVEPFVAPHVAHLPLVVGEGANVKAAEFLSVMNNYPELRDQVHAYVLVADRRWNLRLKNGIDIRLPEADPVEAIEALLELDRDKKLLTRDILAIDLRIHDRVTVRLSDEAAAARAEALKEKKAKRKAGDA
ncbi:cell division protein FtsQ/DivIB [Pseudorhodoplanes sp.]|uniref:cell division protein FtsQ/DivIB n=1 Tax=Pseudorhodoplanes sp. TaxID=1934341 RepID=UPI002C4422A3|nr:FtsQ-type POTRA domain-containing protein [Pseudorhodoplanes sp.]HWV52741.1 FtsQ-type POTRA domain-containing protein [Pseudorhodoplanes sp.]